MIKILNVKYIYKKFVNPKSGLTQNFFISNNRLNSLSIEFKNSGLGFFSTNLYSTNSVEKEDAVLNLRPVFALDKTLGVERYKFQSFPFHLVEQSPWPIVTSFTLLIMACSAVMYFQGFYLGGELLFLGFVLTASAMTLWFRDIVLEGTSCFLNFILFKNILNFKYTLINKSILYFKFITYLYSINLNFYLLLIKDKVANVFNKLILINNKPFYFFSKYLGWYA